MTADRYAIPVPLPADEDLELAHQPLTEDAEGWE